jgi:acetoin utilization deacetylase AcuC-like enzyme
MPRDTPFSVWQQALNVGLDRIRAYAPDALIVSLGVDTFEHDPISFFKLASADYSRYGRMLAGLKLPTLFAFEGGYAVADVGINTVNVLTGFEGG